MFDFRIMKNLQEFRGGMWELAAWHCPPASQDYCSRSRAPSSSRADQRLQAIELLRPRLLPLLNFLSLQPCRPSGHAAHLPCEAQPGGEVMLLSLQHTRKR